MTLLGLEELVAEFGGDLQELAAEIGFDLRDLRRPERLISAGRAHELVNLAAKRLNRRDLGLLWGERSDPSRLGPLHVALMNARTGRDAIEMVVRFLHVNFPVGEVFMRPLPEGRDELLGVRSHLSQPPPLIQFYERRIGSLNVILKTVCGPRYRPKQVWFSHPPNAAIGAYQRVFGLTPMFGMPENGVVIARGMLDATRAAANEQVREMAVSYLKAQGPRPGYSSLSKNTRNMVRILMRSTDATVSATAGALGMHPRALQRRLLAEGSRFEVIKDDVRKTMAKELLEDPAVQLVDIAFALHYANMSAFTRSCTRWFGKPPTSFRRDISKRQRRVTARVSLRRARLRF